MDNIQLRYWTGFRTCVGVSSETTRTASPCVDWHLQPDGYYNAKVGTMSREQKTQGTDHTFVITGVIIRTPSDKASDLLSGVTWFVSRLGNRRILFAVFSVVPGNRNQ